MGSEIKTGGEHIAKLELTKEEMESIGTILFLAFQNRNKHCRVKNYDELLRLEAQINFDLYKINELKQPKI
jgi:hypothetical protein